jgi:hypothetical protein
MELLDLMAEIIRAHEHALLGSWPELCEVRTLLAEAAAERVCYAEVFLRGERGLCMFWL